METLTETVFLIVISLVVGYISGICSIWKIVFKKSNPYDIKEVVSVKKTVQIALIKAFFIQALLVIAFIAMNRFVNFFADKFG